MTLSDQLLSCVQYLHQSTACTYCTVEAKSLRRHIMDSSLSGLQERVAHVDAAAASSVSVNVNYIIYIYVSVILLRMYLLLSGPTNHRLAIDLCWQHDAAMPCWKSK